MKWFWILLDFHETASLKTRENNLLMFVQREVETDGNKDCKG